MARTSPRTAGRASPAAIAEHDIAVLEQRLAQHLRHAFGYGAALRAAETPAPGPRPGEETPQAAWWPDAGGAA